MDAPRSARFDSTCKLTALAVGLALAVHALLLLTDVLPAMMRTWRTLQPRPAPLEPTQVELVSLSSEQFEQHRRLAPRAPRPEPPPEPPRPRGQVVDLAPTPERAPPTEARFLSEHGSRADQETARPDPRPDYHKPRPRPSVARASPARRPGPSAPQPPEPRPAEAAPDEPRPPRPEPDPPSSPALAEPLADSQLPSLEPEPPPRDQAVALAGPAGQPDPADEAGAPAPDHLRDVRPGEATFLNSAQFVYATFFNRVKQQIGQFWHPAVREQFERLDLVGRGPTRDELQTLLVIRLEPDGALESVQLARSCGVAVLDDLALRSVHRAAPFANPPPALAGPDGRIRFAFGFAVSQRGHNRIQ